MDKFKSILRLLARNYLYVVFFLSFTGMIGSLYLSDVARYPACTLCYVQRYFLYPIVFLAAFEISFRRNFIRPIHFILISGIGAGIAAYHNILQVTQTDTLFCEAGGVSCSKIDPVNVFGIDFSIPFMSLLAFATIFCLAVLRFAVDRRKRM